MGDEGEPRQMKMGEKILSKGEARSRYQQEPKVVEMEGDPGAYAHQLSKMLLHGKGVKYFYDSTNTNSENQDLPTAYDRRMVSKGKHEQQPRQSNLVIKKEPNNKQEDEKAVTNE